MAVIAAAVAIRAVLPGRRGDDVAVDTPAPRGPGGAVAGRRPAQRLPPSRPRRATPASNPARRPPRRLFCGPGHVSRRGRKPLILLNPGTVRQGSNVGVTVAASNRRDARRVDQTQETDNGEAITFVQVDKSGGFGGVNFAVPIMPRGSFIVEARQRESDRFAPVGLVAGGSPQIKMGTHVGKPGDTVELSAQGFGRRGHPGLTGTGSTATVGSLRLMAAARSGRVDPCPVRRGGQ